MSVKTITNENFNEVIDNDKIILLDFYADWCGPCQMLSPIIDQIAQENPEYFVGKINVDAQPELAQQFDVVSIPTLVVIKDGEIVDKSSGVRPKQQILDMLQ